MSYFFKPYNIYHLQEDICNEKPLLIRPSVTRASIPEYYCNFINIIYVSINIYIYIYIYIYIQLIKYQPYGAEQRGEDHLNSSIIH